MSDVLFSADALALGYPKRMVLEQVNLTVERGQFWFFLGPNGEGKSTFLKAVLRALPPLAGTLRCSDSFLANCGYVPQRCDLNPTLPTTVREIVSLGLVGISCDARERSERLRGALGKVGLEDYAARSYWALSGGQRQRALVARALIRQPALLIADEPTNGLDVTSETHLLQGLADLNRRERLAIVFVTHQLSLAARYASHVAIFHQGRVTAGLREEILRDDMLARIYHLTAQDFRALFGTARP